MTQIVPSDLIQRMDHKVVMRTLSLLMFLTVVGCTTKQPLTDAPKNQLPTEASNALHNATTFELFSLDPNQRDQKPGVDMFHGWKILGSVEVSDSATRNTLLNALDAGIAENDGTVAACFEPRHGIRVEYDGKQHDFVICFQCYSGKWYTDGKESEGYTLTDSPKPVFDRVLQAASVQLTPPPPD
ncbi:hypothetical protein [Gimesia aquarii]|uniref:Uncharacterized protein n=1 Tax=Gimesia aquarii TaxID=2527964 RepID=A0A517VS43_9PLAN|nr:hypothetical protein [Gimesia aquarii]QDT95823.1 hypothetical protein V144x_12700 [Gimesia aquarii]